MQTGYTVKNMGTPPREIPLPGFGLSPWVLFVLVSSPTLAVSCIPRSEFHLVDSAASNDSETPEQVAPDLEPELAAKDTACSPQCTGRSCGDDGCSGTCGECGAGLACSGEGLCTCTQGNLLCGETCCTTGQACHLGACCTPDCVDKQDGQDDGCGACCGGCCQDGTCEPEKGETCANCFSDCGYCDVCGDGHCVGQFGETEFTCCGDCHSCGDGQCKCGESYQNCPFDCCGTCGDGKCANYPDGSCNENETICAQDCAGQPCGDSICDKGQTPFNCPQDCERFFCGNGVCEPGETQCADCTDLVKCGDCECDWPAEDSMKCPLDCGTCGDGYCSTCPQLGESAATCKQDCDTVP